MDRGAPTDDELGPAVRREPDAYAVGMAYQVIVSPDGERRFSFVGQRCLALNGVTAEAAMANPQLLYDQIIPEHREALLAIEAESIAAGKPFDVEVAMRRPDGEVRWHRIASVPRPLPDGSTAWDGLQIDVTDRRAIAAELEGQRRRLEMAVEATGLGLWEWDLDAHRISWSDRNKALFGLPVDAELTIEEYMGMVHRDDLPKVQAVYQRAVSAGGGDFSVEHRIVPRGGETRWLLTHGHVVTEEGKPKLVVGTSVDITKRKESEERRALLMGELAHRAKNGIAVMMALVQQTARTASDVDSMQEVLMARLQSMATAQDLVTETGGRPVQLLDIVRKTLQPFGLSRFEISPELEGVTIQGDLAVGLGLLLHEMATNAVKYGALSAAKGTVKLLRDESPSGRVVMHWCESGGPQVKRGGRVGFGTRVLESALRPQGGNVDFSFESHGFEARVEFPRA